MLLLIGLTATATTNVPATSTLPTATTCASAAANDGGHVDHAIWTCDEAHHHNRTHNGYVRTATGSYYHGVGTTFIDDTPIGHIMKKQRNKHALN
jgi:hypothetical protein